MVLLTGGAYRIGTPLPVTVRPFCMDVTEVTVDAYTACVQAGQCATEHSFGFKPGSNCNYGAPGRGGHPMNCVDWTGAGAFCQAAGKRLPSEEEWQWAARGGPAATRYPWGNEAPGSQVCWSGVNKRSGTCPVGSSPAGDAPTGVHDLLGNVWEWTATPLSIWLTSQGYDANLRIARGGGWSTTDPSHLTGAIRNWRPPAERSNNLGFRCVR
jgi:formylglycine-generating enzyme